MYVGKSIFLQLIILPPFIVVCMFLLLSKVKNIVISTPARGGEPFATTNWVVTHTKTRTLLEFQASGISNKKKHTETFPGLFHPIFISPILGFEHDGTN